MKNIVSVKIVNPAGSLRHIYPKGNNFKDIVKDLTLRHKDDILKAKEVYAYIHTKNGKVSAFESTRFNSAWMAEMLKLNNNRE